MLRESQGQRSLAGYSPEGQKQSDTTERLNKMKVMGTDMTLAYKTELNWGEKEQKFSCTFAMSPCPGRGAKMGSCARDGFSAREQEKQAEHRKQ